MANTKKRVAPMSKMRKYLRKPPQKRGQDEKAWHVLYKQAVSRAEALEDDRLGFLERGSDNPENTLRRLNIIGQNDLEREFPEKKE